MTVLTRLHDAGLKVNVAKSFFCIHEIEFLSYILTRGGIKPQQKKVQAILALNLPNSVMELDTSLEWFNTNGDRNQTPSHSRNTEGIQRHAV